MPLIWEGLDVAEVCNWVFYAANAVLLYYLIVGAVRWLFWRPQVVARRRAAAATTAAIALLAIAGIPSARGEETPRIDVEVVHPGPPVIVPDDVLIRPYDLQADGGISPSDRLPVPYAKYVELWNRAHPDKKLSQGKPPPLPFAWAGASYAATLEGDESLLLAGRLAIDVFCEGYAVVPMELRGGVLCGRNSTAGPLGSAWPVFPPSRSRKRPRRTTRWRRFALKGRGGTRWKSRFG